MAQETKTILVNLDKDNLYLGIFCLSVPYLAPIGYLGFLYLIS